MEQSDPKAFLGVGVKFPIQADKNTGRIKESSYEEDIQEAIRIILSTRKGERIRNPHFGCGIYDYAFEALDDTTMSAVKHEVEMALVLWEPRIENIEVAVDARQEEGVLLIEIGYVVRSTNNPFNLVFPYYINEGFGG
ncbi:baseplate protein [bacterium D16-51]|nr:baseplate protein [bacterium D16-59]RKI62487.1 baseplate protein [bacterium D16-51]